MHAQMSLNNLKNDCKSIKDKLLELETLDAAHTDGASGRAAALSGFEAVVRERLERWGIVRGGDA